MKRSIYQASISLLLAIVMLFNFIACSGISSGITSENNSGSSALGDGKEPSANEPTYPTVPTAVIDFYSNPATKVVSLAKTTLPVDEIESFNVKFSVDKNVGLKSYSVTNGIDVIFETSADQYSILDAISVDDEIALEQIYYHNDSDEPVNLSEIYADYYSVEVDYTASGKVSAIYYVDSYYIFKYDSSDRLTSVYRNGSLWKSYVYNGQNKVISETAADTGITRSYSYNSSGKLIAINSKTVPEVAKNENSITAGNNSFTLTSDKLIASVKGDVPASFTYGYEFNGQKYVTSKTVNGKVTRYSYLGDKVVAINKGVNAVHYILDNDLNYVGLKFNGVKYYFAIDPFGNVMSLMDCDGNVAVKYSYDVWGSVISVEGALASTLGEVNEITNLSGIYDFDLNAYFMGSELYMPSYGVVVTSASANGISDAVCTHEWTQNGYFYRSAVTDFAKIHDKVVSVTVDNLKDAGLDVVSNLYATDNNGNTKRLVDIYTLPYCITPFSAMNLIDGNQIYEVIYHSPDSMAFEQLAEKKLQTINAELSVSYFGDYNNVTVGTMKFNGQFVYLGYLIDYKCMGNGVVEYQVKINKKSNYDQTVNIYDYDNDKYICYVNNTFDLDFLEGVTIIPGITQETFDKIDGYLGDYLQTVSGDICDQMLIYDDPSYYNTAEMNVMPDYWAQINLSDPTTYLEMQVDGSIKVETMPAWETDGFQTKLLIGAGVILLTAVVATVAIMIPGANCIVVSICVGAAKGAIGGALSGFAFGAVSGAAGEFIGQVSSGKDIDWEKIGNSALNSAADGFASGAITGAIMGGISGGLNPKYCFEAGTPIATANGAVAIENIAVGDMVWSYDYKTGEKSLKPVTATTIRETNKVVTLEIGGEQIVTTPEHPFYIVNNDKYNGYVAAKYLSVGDCIQTADGGYVEITAIEQQTLDEPITVYNFTVDDNHSYYVGENELLVHNVSCTEIKAREISNLDYHYNKHVIKQGEFGNISKPEYVKKANNFVNSYIKNGDTGSLVSGVSKKDGVSKVIFNKVTNEIAIIKPNDIISTYYIPTPSYYNNYGYSTAFEWFSSLIIN